MKKGLILLIALFFTTLFVQDSSAQTPTFKIPDHARQVSENVYYLGKKVDPGTGKKVDGYIIVERGKSGQAKPDHAGGPKNNGGSDKSSCYDFLARGARWKGTPEDWVMNTSNIDGLDGSTVFSIMQNAIGRWEAAAGDTEILGNGSTTPIQLVADQSGAPDDVNEVYFADIEGTSTIGVTIVWGIFGGPPSGRQLVEWDQVYDDVTFDWSAEAGPVQGKMDFDSIATHELGHAVGLADLYEITCSDETMYGYGSTGDISARTLNTGDVTGIQQLYK